MTVDYLKKALLFTVMLKLYACIFFVVMCIYFFSSWPDESKANKICQELDCGDHYNIPKPGMFKGQQTKKNVLLNCNGNDQYSWQCMEWSNCQERASVICNSKCLLLLNSSMEYFALIGVNEMVLKALLRDTILPSISMVCVRGKIHIYTEILVLHRSQEVTSTRWQQCLLWVGGREHCQTKLMESSSADK